MTKQLINCNQQVASSDIHQTEDMEETTAKDTIRKEHSHSKIKEKLAKDFTSKVSGSSMEKYQTISGRLRHAKHKNGITNTLRRSSFSSPTFDHSKLNKSLSMVLESIPDQNIKKDKAKCNEPNEILQEETFSRTYKIKLYIPEKVRPLWLTCKPTKSVSHLARKIEGLLPPKSSVVLIYEGAQLLETCILRDIIDRELVMLYCKGRKEPKAPDTFEFTLIPTPID